MREGFLLESFLSVHAVSERSLARENDRKKLLIPPGSNGHRILPRVVSSTRDVGRAIARILSLTRPAR
jgi:hypothetical protein